jgi:hypothetical protein
MRAHALAVVVGSVVLAGAAAPFQHPDFSGSYKLDRNATSGPSPDGGVIRIEHHDPTISVRFEYVYAGEPGTDSFTVTTDGRERVTRTGETRRAVSCVWSGDTLVVATSQTPPEGLAPTTTRFVLLDGGQTLEAHVHKVEPDQTYDAAMVFRRLR